MNFRSSKPGIQFHQHQFQHYHEAQYLFRSIHSVSPFPEEPEMGNVLDHNYVEEEDASTFNVDILVEESRRKRRRKRRRKTRRKTEQEQFAERKEQVPKIEQAELEQSNAQRAALITQSSSASVMLAALKGLGAPRSREERAIALRFVQYDVVGARDELNELITYLTSQNCGVVSNREYNALVEVASNAASVAAPNCLLVADPIVTAFLKCRTYDNAESCTMERLKGRRDVILMGWPFVRRVEGPFFARRTRCIDSERGPGQHDCPAKIS